MKEITQRRSKIIRIKVLEQTSDLIKFEVTFNQKPNRDLYEKAEDRVRRLCDKINPFNGKHVTWGGFWTGKEVDHIIGSPCTSFCCRGD